MKTQQEIDSDSLMESVENAVREGTLPDPILTTQTHTPAPWKYVEQFKADKIEGCGSFNIYAENGKVLSMANWNDVGHTSVESKIEAEANAALIASAPETAKERDELKAIIENNRYYLPEQYEFLKALNAELLDELKKSDRIITLMLNALSPSDKVTIAKRLAGEGVSSEGMVRAHEREELIQKATKG